MPRPRPAKLPALDRAAVEIQEGRLWRAKEILAGLVGSGGYSPETFLAYGRLLSQMRDTKEAGKYLFLSGIDTPSDGNAVELFTATLRGGDPLWIKSQFPGCLRRTPATGLPDRLQTRLRDLGFPDSFAGDAPLFPPKQSNDKGGLKGTIGFLAIAAIALVILLGLIHGAMLVAGWLFGK